MQNSISRSGQDVFLNRVLDKAEEQGLDCRSFRQSYIERRIASRLRATGCDDYLSYYHYLEQRSDECLALIKALTVNVTRFFRDEEVFQELETEVFPKLIAANSSRGRSSIRIWSAGCASGEEVFSLAMIGIRCLEQSRAALQCLVYGTDIDAACISRGRRGVYPIGDLEAVPDRYRKYIVRIDSNTFSFTPEIREMTRFIKMDLFVDKPIKHVDLVVCRNTMIYSDRKQQHQLIDKFYQSIVQGGFLNIGKSERLQYDRRAFVTINANHRIYQKMGVKARQA